MAATRSFSPSTRMLKDFLRESNGNRKSKTASFTSQAIHAVVAAVKKISFPSVKSPRILLRKRERDEREIRGDFVVKVKDIIRWRSFGDLVDETAAPPFDFADSPDRYTAAATTATTTTATSSSNSSWCESDFMAEDLSSPSWRGCSDGGVGGVGKMYLSCVGEDSRKATNSENDRKVNVLSMHDDEEEQNICDERVRRLSEHVKDAISLSESCRMVEHCRLDWLSMEFIQSELTHSQKSEDKEEQVKNIENIIMNIKEDENDYEWVLSQKGKEAYVREMERDGKWGVFGNEEKIELGLEIEGGILDCLVDEIILDILQ